MSARNFRTAMSLGEVGVFLLTEGGVRARQIRGERGTVTNVLLDINNYGNINWPTAATGMRITGTAAADTAAGTGAQQATVVYLDDAFNLLTETVELVGIGSAALVAEPYRVLSMFVSRCGTGGLNAGTLTLENTGGGTTYALIAVGEGQSSSMSFTIPADYRGCIKQLTMTNTGATSTEFVLWAREDGGAWRHLEHGYSWLTAGIDRSYEPPMAMNSAMLNPYLAPGTDIKVQARNQVAGNINFAGSLGMLLFQGV